MNTSISLFYYGEAFPCYARWNRVTNFDLQITGSADAAMEVLIDGIRNAPLCKLLLEVFLLLMEQVL